MKKVTIFEIFKHEKLIIVVNGIRRSNPKYMKSLIFYRFLIQCGYKRKDQNLVYEEVS